MPDKSAGNNQSSLESARSHSVAHDVKTNNSQRYPLSMAEPYSQLPPSLNYEVKISGETAHGGVVNKK